MRIRQIIIGLSALCLLVSCRHKVEEIIMPYNDTLPPVVEDYVGLQDGHFVLNGKEWFPIMLNYKVEMQRVGDSLEVVPVSYYNGGSVREHFDTIASWGFNAVRVCLDVLSSEGDSASMFRATRRMVQTADSAGLRVMLLIKPPFEPYWQSYTKGLLRHLSDLPALWAYDFMNEPLYFDPEERRDKQSAVSLVAEWRHWVRTLAPRQLFTVALAEPIEVFEWDPALLPVDFIEMHTYHPLRVASEMWWYSHYAGKPWMIGETGLPADNDSVPYQWQCQFLTSTFYLAEMLGAIGYGWWEFQDSPAGVNFEAQYTGLRDSTGKAKLAADMKLVLNTCRGIDYEAERPVNYFNMLAYTNICLTGRVVDEDGNPIEGAVLRGWNEDWSVGMNTFTDEDGRFTLYSNDYCVHFELSAAGMTHLKFDRRNLHYINIGRLDPNALPNRDREYQQIDYRQYLNIVDGKRSVDLVYTSSDFNNYGLKADMGTLKLVHYKIVKK